MGEDPAMSVVTATSMPTHAVDRTTFTPLATSAAVSISA